MPAGCKSSAAVRGWIPLCELDDDQLALRAAGGDERAFTVLVQRWRPRLERFCEGVLGDRDLAEEAAQDALCRAHRALSRRSATGGFGSWLAKIAYNAAISQARRTRRHEACQLDERVPGPVDVAEQVAMKLRLAHIVAGIAELPNRQRQVLSLRLVEMEYGQIAGLLGITSKAAQRAGAVGRANLELAAGQPSR